MSIGFVILDLEKASLEFINKEGRDIIGVDED